MIDIEYFGFNMDKSILCLKYIVIVLKIYYFIGFWRDDLYNSYWRFM